MVPKVSVIIPVYNVQREWLEASIESILNQTYQDFECLIVDDGSTDQTFETCQRYAEKDARIRLFRFEMNKGIAAAMNFAILNASSPLIAIHDGDDISLPTRLEKQYAYMKEHPDVVLLGTQIKLKFEARVSEAYKQSSQHFVSWYNACLGERMDREFIKGTCVANGTAMFKKESAIRTGLYKQQYGRILDWEMFLRLKDLGTVAKLDEVLYVYRRHEASFCYQADNSDPFGEVQIPYIHQLFQKGTQTAIWGAGNGARTFLKAYGNLPNPSFDVRFVIDGAGQKVGEKMEGFRIEAPGVLKKNPVDKVIVAVSVHRYLLEIKAELGKLGYKENQIVELYAPA